MGRTRTKTRMRMRMGMRTRMRMRTVKTPTEMMTSRRRLCWQMQLERRELMFTTQFSEPQDSWVWHRWLWWLGDEHNLRLKLIWSCGHSEDDELQFFRSG